METPFFDIDGNRFAVTGVTVRPFFVLVPHQMPASLDWPECAEEPNEEAGDRYIEGDHDLHTIYRVESLDDALPLLQHSDGRGGQARHQAIKVAVLVKNELVSQGVLAEEVTDEDD